MSKQPNSTKIGAFVVGAIALVAIVIAVFGGGKLFTQKQRFVTFFRGSTAGLAVGSPVRLKGVDIGEVKKVTALFAQDWEFYVEVIIEVDTKAVVEIGHAASVTTETEVLALIARGLRAQLETQSYVLGSKYVKLDLFPDAELVYHMLNSEYQEIPSIQGVGAQMEHTMKRLVREVEDIPIAELTKALLSTIQGVDSLVRSPEILRSVAAFERTMGETTEVLGAINSRIEPLAMDASEMMIALETTLASADTLLVLLNDVTLENQAELYTAMKEMTETARTMRNLMEYLQRNPDAVIWGKD